MHRPERRSPFCLAVAALVLVLAGTATAHAHPDPLAPYHWVNPPPEAAAGNVTPAERVADLPANRDRLPATDVWTGDLQAVLSLADTPLPARERTAVSVAISPRDASTLGPLPAPMRGDGNAYEVALRDGQADVGALAVPGKLVLTVPRAATAVLFSVDGATWTAVDARSTQPNQVEARFARAGFYVAATDQPVGGTGGASGPSAVMVALLIALPVLAVGGLLALARRRVPASP